MSFNMTTRSLDPCGAVALASYIGRPDGNEEGAFLKRSFEIAELL
jgi:hypothetical protein